MRPVDSFLRSVRDAFRPADTTPDWVWIGLAFLVSTVVLAALYRYQRRRQLSRLAFVRFLAERKVSATQFRLLEELAARAEVEARVVATHIDVFERASALELARHGPVSPEGGDVGIYAELGTLRRALGFQVIGEHFALLTTRELGPGQLVEVMGAEATVVEVNEACFAVAAPASASFPLGPTGSSVRLTLVHGHEARYEARCALLAREAGETTQRMKFAHDERPTRIQARKAVRVTVRGPVRLSPLGGAAAVAVAGAVETRRELGIVQDPVEHVLEQPLAEPSGEASAERATDPPREPAGAPSPTSDEAEVAPPESPLDELPVGNGSLIDISVGGAALSAHLRVPVGSLVLLSFELEGVVYRDLLALVLECQARARGLHHMRLEFRNLPQADEHRLAASVARYSARPFAQQG